MLPGAKFALYLATKVQLIVLDSDAMRKPVHPHSPYQLQDNGSNLPQIIELLQKESPEHFKRWVEHLRVALPDVDTMRVIERPEDRHKYIMLKYQNGVEIPQWSISDGTLRLMALTILAYIPDLEGTFLIEEPENGIHPRAVEVMMQSLQSVYNGQVLISTHSPMLLNLVEPEDLLIFTRENGETHITPGDEHPFLSNWKRDVSLSTLIASGVLD
jgi:predicted ATPase